MRRNLFIRYCLLLSASTLIHCQSDLQSEVLDSDIKSEENFIEILSDIIDTSTHEDVQSELTREQENPDIHLSIPELIKKYGFPVETHTVITEDDYVLTLYRIPHGRSNGNETAKRSPIFLQHGLLSQAGDWLMNTVEKALGYKLADEGYDVWLGNARGTTASQKHVRFSTASSSYWDYSFHEMGKYDIPAVIDYILNKTEEQNMYYVGHSMGTTMYYVAMSLKPEYNKKIRLMISLGPSAYLNHIKNGIKYIAPMAAFDKAFLDILGNGKLVPSFLLKYLHKYAPVFCDPDETLSYLCENIIFAFGGIDAPQTNVSQIPVILAHTPAETSTKTVNHYAQLVTSGKFQQYDYGFIKNLRIYNRFTPPQYNFAAITSPVALFWGPNDILCVPEDVQRIAEQLPNLAANYPIKYKEFSHIDFLFAIDADKLLNAPLLKLLKKY